MADRETVAHLLRRATFGPSAEEVDAAERAGPAATLNRLLRPAGADPGAAATPVPVLGVDPTAALRPNSDRQQRQEANQRRREQSRQLLEWWLDRMVAAEHQLTEKLVFFWHGHWATSIRKVRSAQLMLGQLDTLRRHGRGDYGTLIAAMVRDPALIRWLDGQRNTRAAPNENLARELLELFTLGVGHYTEADVKAGARALTGWTVDRRTGAARFVIDRHDAGPKTILGRTATFGAVSYARLLARQPRTAQFIRDRLWLRFAGPSGAAPTPAAGGESAAPATVGGQPPTDTLAALRSVLTDPAFPATRGQRVKEPVDWAVGAMRQLGIRPSALTGQRRGQLLTGLSGMDQVPLHPPSVGGWPTGTGWLNTSSLQARMRLAELFATAAAPLVGRRLAAAPAAGRLDALERLLVVDAWTERTRAALTPLVDRPERLLAAALVSPEYTVD
ncbi:DUF1800 domain-containing protein [Solwaraspora sp. WMMD1047]|uniref:DUF1800 domain-containing protein n=1 Tax=Solwaraspora sp. WMMD1047 TaxID=3016102 RepID=UPI0024174781|nr:DUF1800 domain-containing protein [Solwaraspora sp. WMMD1047]MDG4829038.1 DUF1800 domain-containing protein [Solwaraspora sp. WMMD1047]